MAVGSAVQVNFSVSVVKLKHSLLTRHMVLYLSRKLSSTLAFKQKRNRPGQFGDKKVRDIASILSLKSQQMLMN